jgi:Mrp family chromosome partitioning ATPase
VDAPPVLGLADAPLISTAVASVLFVVEAGVPRVNAIRRSMARIRELRGNIVGVIFAKFNMRRSMSEEYGYYGYYSYGSDEKSGRS